MNHLDLFSGIGGFALAGTWVWGDEYRNVGHSDIEKFPCRVYHKHFPGSPCLGDITKIDWSSYEGRVDILTAGFPCQPHSVAGKRQASKDERDLSGEVIRAIGLARPRYALLENVPGLLISERGEFFNGFISRLAEIGYAVEYRILSAASVGAPHRRERVWIVAYSDRQGLQGRNGEIVQERSGKRIARKGDSVFSGPGEPRSPEPRVGNMANGLPGGLVGYFGGWEVEPSHVPRVAEKIPDRMSKLKGLGNSIVPQCAAVIMQAIKDSDERAI